MTVSVAEIEAKYGMPYDEEKLVEMVARAK